MTINLLRRIILFCLVYHAFGFLWGAGVADFAILHRLSFVGFWLLLSWLFYKWPEKASLPIGLFMLTSVAAQGYLLRFVLTKDRSRIASWNE